MQETGVQPLDQEDPLEKEMARKGPLTIQSLEYGQGPGK